MDQQRVRITLPDSGKQAVLMLRPSAGDREQVRRLVDDEDVGIDVDELYSGRRGTIVKQCLFRRQVLQQTLFVREVTDLFLGIDQFSVHGNFISTAV